MSKSNKKKGLCMSTMILIFLAAIMPFCYASEQSVVNETPSSCLLSQPQQIRVNQENIAIPMQEDHIAGPITCCTKNIYRGAILNGWTYKMCHTQQDGKPETFTSRDSVGELISIDKKKITQQEFIQGSQTPRVVLLRKTIYKVPLRAGNSCITTCVEHSINATYFYDLYDKRDRFLTTGIDKTTFQVAQAAYLKQKSIELSKTETKE